MEQSNLVFVFLLLVVVVNCTSIYPARSNYVRTPFGLIHKSCVHHIPNGAHIDETNNGTFRVIYDGRDLSIESCRKHLKKNEIRFNKPRQDYDGWLAYTAYNYQNTFDSFLGFFTVPDAPQQTPEVFYLFTGLQNVDWIPIIDPQPDQFDIIQPVLQYPGDNGNYWSVKSWYVTLTNDVLTSDEIEVNTGDNIFGNMTRTGPSTWYIGGTDGTQNTYLSVTRDLLISQPWAYCTAEGYGVEGCSYEPTQPCVFTKLQLFSGGQQITPQWTPYSSPNQLCNERAQVGGPDSVTLLFQQ